MSCGRQAHQQFVALDAHAQLAVHKKAVAAKQGAFLHIAALRQRGAHGVDQVQGFVAEGAGGHGLHEMGC